MRTNATDTRHGSNPRKRAFTLIELLVVIAIISVLVSILTPTLARAKELACRAACAANQHSIYYGIFEYCQDNNEKLPPYDDRNVATAYWRRWGEWVNLGSVVWGNYLPPDESMHCPGFRNYRANQYEYMYQYGSFKLRDLLQGVRDGTIGGNSHRYSAGSFIFATWEYHRYWWEAPNAFPADGRFGEPGRERAGVPAVSYVQCVVEELFPDVTSTVTHMDGGFNSLYVDGSVQWLELTEDAVEEVRSWETYPYTSIYGNRWYGGGLWRYASMVH